MMYRILSLLLVFLPLWLSAQIENPVTWDISTRQVSEGEYEVVFKATIEPGWHLYSQNVKEGGPIPTSFNFEEIDGVEMTGETSQSSNIHTNFDKMFDMEVGYYEGYAVFVQKFRQSQSPAKTTGYLEFMVCNNTKCLAPQTIDFNLTF